MSNDNKALNAQTMKYAMLRVKEETAERFYRYVGMRTHERSKRITADEAINELLDAKGVE